MQVSLAAGSIKDECKPEKGKCVFLEALGGDIEKVEYVENDMVYGDGRDYNICLVVPDFLVPERKKYD
jgi:long-chain acyl-CoA synthetase